MKMWKWNVNSTSTVSYTVPVIILHTVEAATDVRKKCCKKQKRKIIMPQIFYTSKREIKMQQK